MIKLLEIRKFAWIAFFIAIFCSFIMASVSHAGEASDSAAFKHGITFPIAQLGNCKSLGECKQFCDDPTNKDVCIAFAKTKGLYKEQGKAAKASIVNSAQQELGCTSENACKTFCAEKVNWQKCGEFAKKHNLGGTQTKNPQNPQILQIAKNLLGCDSYDTCRNFCQVEVNREKCSELARMVGLKERPATPSGINKGPQGMPSYQNADEKARFCKEFPEKCASTGGSFATSSGQMSPDQYCKLYPDRCPKPLSPTTVDPAKNRSPYPQATATTSTCQSPSGGCGAYHYFDSQSCSCKSYQDYCQSKPGCSWTGTSCQCQNTYSPVPTITTSGNIGTTSSVKGISAIRGFLDRILDSFRN